MAYGYNGKILHVDLTNRTTEVEQPDDKFYRKYMGGKAIVSYYLNRLVPPGADPLGPDNILVLATSVVCGAPMSGFNRFSAGAKSPLTGGYGEGEAGGWWAPEFKSAGFDAIVIKGQSPSPVYLWIHDGEVEIRSAEQLWGLDTRDSQEMIRQELDDPRVRIAQIGPAGEKLVRYACICNELRHFNGRGGMGAVMGSKKLKAVAVRGHGRIAFKDAKTLASLAKDFAAEVLQEPSTAELQAFGTPGITIGLNDAGMLPTRNFRSGRFEGVDGIDHNALGRVLVSNGTCHACVVRCKREVAVKNDRFTVDPIFGGPEYEAMSCFGSVCGVSDVEAICKANELCNRYTMDVISAGVSIAFAMECFEKGIISEADTDGLKLTWGNADAMLAMVEKIARRDGFGDLLAEGVKRAAEMIGRGSDKYALHVKGQEMPAQEPRVKHGTGIGIALCDVGADHIMVAPDPFFQQPSSRHLKELAPLGILDPVDIFDMGWKRARLYCAAEAVHTLWKVLDVCMFCFAPRTWQPLNRAVQAVQAVTGWDTSLYELMKVSERAAAMSRVFNVKCGRTRADDWLPDRFFEPLEDGVINEDGINRDELNAVLDLVYEMKGWDPATAKPTKAKLLELDLDWLLE